MIGRLRGSCRLSGRPPLRSQLHPDLCKSPLDCGGSCPELVADAGERPTGAVEACRYEDVAGLEYWRCRVDATGLEVSADGGAVDVELVGELVDADASGGGVQRRQFVNLGRFELAGGSVRDSLGQLGGQAVRPRLGEVEQAFHLVGGVCKRLHDPYQNRIFSLLGGYFFINRLSETDVQQSF